MDSGPQKMSMRRHEIVPCVPWIRHLPDTSKKLLPKFRYSHGVVTVGDSGDCKNLSLLCQRQVMISLVEWWRESREGPRLGSQKPFPIDFLLAAGEESYVH